MDDAELTFEEPAKERNKSKGILTMQTREWMEVDRMEM